MPTETVEQYLADFARHLIHELEPIVSVKQVTTNSDLLGKYAEAAMRRFIRRFVHPMHVSTGAILDYPRPEKLRQLDLIVWAPFPAPAIFEVEDFALVPRSSTFGVIEMKRSSYDKAVIDLEEFVREVPAIIGNDPPRVNDDPAEAVMGVIGVIDGTPSQRLKTLLEQKRVVGIFDRNGEGADVRPQDIITLVNFLHRVSWRYRVRASQPGMLQLTANPSAGS